MRRRPRPETGFSARSATAAITNERLLEAGINVVSTTSTDLVFPPSADAGLRDRLGAAARRGGASLYASGIFPGFASDELALLLITPSRSIRTVRLIEVSLNVHCAQVSDTEACA